MRKKNLLIDEYPLIVLPSLAKAIGLNEAIALQQLHYWLENPKGGVMLDGERWVYNTYEDWQKDNFPFWSISTIQRIFASLEKMELVISKQKAEYDRKKYYRIHHVNLTRWNVPDWNDATRQDDTIEDVKMASSLTETTENTTEKPNIFQLYEKNIGVLIPMIADKLEEAEKEYPADWIADAFQLAVENNKRNWRYCETILKRWQTDGKDEGRGNGNKEKASEYTTLT